MDPDREGRLTAPANLETLRCVVERIIPSDDGYAGAREAGTLDYVVERATRNEATVAIYLDGLAELERRAARTRSARFVDLSPTDQDRILGGLEAAGDPFFRRVLLDTMEGFYGDPRHGGNRDGVSWTMIGFPGPTGGRGYAPPLGWYDAHVGHGSMPGDDGR